MATSVTAKAVITSEDLTEIQVHLKNWTSPLVLDQCVAHGVRIKQGEILLTLEAEKIAQAVTAAREERALAALTIKLADLELPLLKQQLPLDMRAAERTAQQASADLERFLKIEKERDIESAKFALKAAEVSVLESRDELNQLEKMYRDKDLTEETEQMILKRYRFNLEQGEFQLQSTRLHTERTLTIDLPRREESARLAAARASIAWERARDELPLTVQQKELALEKLKLDHKRAQEKLADLEQDLKQMTILAPTAGVVYRGRFSNGQWSAPAPAAYHKGGALPSNEVVLTIVGDGRLLLAAEIDEKDIGDLQVGRAARFSPTRSPHRKLAGKVQQVAAAPQGGKFEVLIAVTETPPAGIIPGLTGQVKITTAEKDNALWVPSAAVFEDPETESAYVHLDGPGSPKKTVTIGLVAGDRTEIVAGLAAGDEILALKP